MYGENLMAIPIKNINDIKLVVQEFRRIMKEENDSEVINRFKQFTYWYYFPKQEIFVPNKFLGYIDNASKPYNPSQGSGMNGGVAKKSLAPFFEDAKDKNLHSKLNVFSKEYGKDIKRDVVIFELKEEYYDIFSEVKEQKNDFSLEENSASGKQVKKIITPRRSVSSDYRDHKKNKHSKSPFLGNSSDSSPDITPHVSIKVSSKTYKIMVRKAKDHIILINEYRTKNKMKPIFKESGILKLLDGIESLCVSEASFVLFIKNLYILYREKTRDKNTNYKNKNDHYYIYRFPEIFWEDEKITRHSMDNICIIRNVYLHSEDEEQESKNQKPEKKSFLEVVYELTLKEQKLPELREDFQELQYKIIEQFEEAMRELLQMVKDELNPPNKPLTS
jgi:hypothetical protein